MDRCFTCGAERPVSDFRYATKDIGGSGIEYFSCNTECLLELAKSEREHNAEDDVLQAEG